MNAKDSFDTIINTIEELSQGCIDENGFAVAFDDLFIRDEAFRRAGYEWIKAKNEIFLFLTGLNIRDYIKQRKSVAAFNLLASASEWNDLLQNNAILIAGQSDYSNLCTRVFKPLGVTPKEAFEKTRKAFLPERVEWEKLSSCGKETVEELNADKDTKYGVPKKVMDMLSEAADLEEFYDMPSKASEKAFSMSIEYNEPLKDTFAYVDACRSFNYYMFEEPAIEFGLLLNASAFNMYTKKRIKISDVYRIERLLSHVDFPFDINEADSLCLLGYLFFYRLCYTYPDCKIKTLDYLDYYDFFVANEHRINEKRFRKYLKLCVFHTKQDAIDLLDEKKEESDAPSATVSSHFINIIEEYGLAEGINVTGDREKAIDIIDVEEIKDMENFCFNEHLFSDYADISSVVISFLNYRETVGEKWEEDESYATYFSSYVPAWNDNLNKIDFQLLMLRTFFILFELDIPFNEISILFEKKSVAYWIGFLKYIELVVKYEKSMISNYDSIYAFFLEKAKPYFSMSIYLNYIEMCDGKTYEQAYASLEDYYSKEIQLCNRVHARIQKQIVNDVKTITAKRWKEECDEHLANRLVLEKCKKERESAPLFMLNGVIDDDLPFGPVIR